MFQFEISNMVVNIDCEDPELMERLQEFSISNYRNSDLDIIIKRKDFIEIPEGTMITSEFIKWLSKPIPTEGYYVYTKGMYSDSVLTLGDFDAKWRSGKITYFNSERKGSPYYKEHTDMYLHNLMGILFRYNLINYEGIVIHSSTIKYKGKGIMFSAPSGTGKSTHVRLWQECFGDDVIVINDDTPAVRFKEDIPYVYGTPWSGTSNIHTNDNAPLVAIVILEQSPINTIKRLTAQESILRLMPRAFLPYFDEEMMNMACIVFEKIISSVPVYLLKCRPDRESVEMVYQCVK